MKFRVLLALVLAAALQTSSIVHAAEPSTSYAVVMPGSIGFGSGGIEGEFLIFKDWSATPPVPYCCEYCS